MSANSVFVQALADACDRPVEVSRHLEATTLGAGLLAGLATGMWEGVDDVSATWVAKSVVEPSGRPSASAGVVHPLAPLSGTRDCVEHYPLLGGAPAGA